MTRINNIFISLLLSLFPLLGMAQGQCETSSLIRQLVSDQERKSASAFSKSIGKGATTNADDALKGAMHAQEGMEDNRLICCFVKMEQGIDAEEKIASLGGKCHAVMGDLCIATLPISQLPKACNAKGIRRIEAKRSNTQCLIDTTRTLMKAKKVNEGTAPLPQPFTGKGTLLGIMDIGFDITHPNWLSKEDGSLRIKRMWDFLDIDSPQSGTTLTIGGEHIGEQDLLAYKHSADGLEQTHGTHTLGIAAGSGYDSKYIGIVPDAEICCVANIAEDNEHLLPDSLEYLVTYALDALGFKYIFDYADQIGKPCVISFSEGGDQDLRGDDKLYYEMLEKMSGPGRIIVSAAGNRGLSCNFIHKPAGKKDAVAGIRKWAFENAAMHFTIDTSAPIDVMLVAYGRGDRKGINDTIPLHFDFVPGTDSKFSDSGMEIERIDTIRQDFGNEPYTIIYSGYPNCYDDSRFAYEIDVTTPGMIGYSFDIDLIVREIGKPADVKVYSSTGELVWNSTSQRNDGTSEASVVSPASAPCVICVGSNSYRTYITNYKGQKMSNDSGTDGMKTGFSSTGPTVDNRTKPDVVAPGVNIISSYNSYYLEENPNAGDIEWDVEHFNYNGRTYPWNCNSGTSMACPVVAGIVATWLEACPTLSPDDVLDVISHTSRQLDSSLSYPNNICGYGEIDAYAGLLYILHLDNIAEVSHHQSTIISRVSSCGEGVVRIEISEPQTNPLPCRVYNTAGKLISTFTIPANTSSYDAHITPQKGICIMQVGRSGSFIYNL